MSSQRQPLTAISCLLRAQARTASGLSSAMRPHSVEIVELGPQVAVLVHVVLGIERRPSGSRGFSH